jgi:hypothetical protein
MRERREKKRTATALTFAVFFVGILLVLAVLIDLWIQTYIG